MLPGATQAEVRDMLGEPTDTDSGGGLERWLYRRPFRLAEFQVNFDLTGRVQEWNYDR